MNEGMIENSLNLIIQRLASSDYVAVSQKAQWSRTWGVGYFGVNFFFAFFLLVWTPFIYMGWEKMFRVHKITDYVV